MTRPDDQPRGLHRKPRFGLKILTLLLAAAPALAAVPKPKEGPLLFRLGDVDVQAERSANVRSIRSIELDRGVLAQRAVTRSMMLQLPEGPPLHVQRMSSANREKGDFTWHGRTTEGAKDWGQIVLTQVGPQTVATIRTRHGSFQIRPQPDGGHALMELAETGKACAVEDAHARSRSPRIATGDSKERPRSTVAYRSGAPRTLDVLVVYNTDAAFEALGTIEAAIQNAIDDANAAFVASSDEGTVAQLNLVDTAEVAYESSWSISDDLDWVTEDPTVAALRDAASADLVALVVQTPFAEACGVGWLMEEPSVDFEDSAFSVVVLGCFGKLSLAHEVGHNLGLSHNYESADPAYFPWSYGYYVSDLLTGFRTVMSYEDCVFCPRVGQFSNPGITFNGHPTGTVVRDNHHTLQTAAGEGTVTVASQFRIGPNDDDRYEPNETRADAFNLSTNSFTWLSSFRGEGIQRDEDWYRIEVPADLLFVTVNLVFDHADGDIDLMLTDELGNPIATSQSITDDEDIGTTVPGPGTYYIRVYFGNAGNSYDLRWDTLAPTLDLTVEDVSTNASPNMGAFDLFRVFATVANRGQDTSNASTIRYYRSTDAYISASDSLLSVDPVPSLLVGGTSAQSTIVSMPSSTGTYWFGACVDPVEGEYTTGNNCSDGVPVHLGPDLTVKNVATNPLIVNPGGTYSYSAEVHNVGGSASGEIVEVIFRISPTPGVTGDDDFVYVELSGSIDRGGFVSFSTDLVAPFEPGTYWPGVCVGTPTGDLDTSNQCASGAPFVVMPVLFADRFETGNLSAWAP